MPVVTIALNGRNYDISVGAGQEARVQELAGEIRRHMDTLTKNAAPVSENLLFALTALLLADELDQKSREAAKLRDEAQNHTDERETALVQTIETLAGKIEAIAARLEAA
jgi:cell division protein ZapA